MTHKYVFGFKSWFTEEINVNLTKTQPDRHPNSACNLSIIESSRRAGHLDLSRWAGYLRWESPVPVIFSEPKIVSPSSYLPSLKDPFRVNHFSPVSLTKEGPAWSPILGSVFLLDGEVYLHQRGRSARPTLEEWQKETPRIIRRHGITWGRQALSFLDEDICGPIFFTRPFLPEFVPKCSLTSTFLAYPPPF